MAKTLDTEVIIIGAGPTGLMAANQLARFGIDFIIVDQKSGPTIESRAIVVTARSLEIYEQMGLADDVVQNGQRVELFNLYTNGKRKAVVKIGEIGRGLSTFSYMLAFEQSKNEELLSQNLVEKHKDIHWDHEFVRLLQHKDSIEALVKHGSEDLTIKARYLVAADGANSQVRQQLNFSFRGGTYDHKFFVADALVRWEMGYNRMIISPGDDNFCAFIPLKNDHTYRVIGTLPRRYANQDHVHFRDIEDSIIKAIGVNLAFESVNWFSVYKLHHRAVDHFREGNVFLAGDSAHIHSPAGGQGMNTGLQDAYNLCWKLAMVLKGKARPELLQTYNEERLPFAKWLLRFTDRGFNMMTSSNWFIRFFRKHLALNIAGLVLSNGLVRVFAFRTISQIGYAYQNCSMSKSFSRQKLVFRAGERLPFIMQENIYPLFKEPEFHLLHIGDIAVPTAVAEKIKRVLSIDLVLVDVTLSDHWRALGVKKELFVLVRPDNYLALIFDECDDPRIVAYAKRYFVMK
jgi:2-polyprenyl-6-methoxyphenol hydroxylase-like FAD-dependent oxidoreductase